MEKLNKELKEHWETTKEKREDPHTNRLFKKNESIIKSEFTTLSIRRDIKERIESLQLEVKNKIDVNITYSDLIKCLIEIAEFYDGNLTSLIMCKRLEEKL